MTRRDFAKCIGVCIASVIVGECKLIELAEDDDDEEEPTMPR